MTISLIRHTESIANSGQRTSDPATIPLTEYGLAQAQLLADQCEQSPDLIITSRYERTQATAQPMRLRFPAVPHEIWDVHEWTYLSAEQCVNTTMIERQPLVRQFWLQCDPHYQHASDTESWAMLVTRARETIDRLQQLQDKQILMFTHGQFMSIVWFLATHRIVVSAASMYQWRNWARQHPIENGAILDFLTLEP